MSIFKKVYIFIKVFIREMWNEMGKLKEPLKVEIEIHSGNATVIKKPTGISINIKDFDTDGLEEEDLNWDIKDQV